jgi:PiT family inorganic phosphate transporter
LSKILATWVACPILGGIFGALLYKLVVISIDRASPHLLRVDMLTRLGLILAGAFGSYSLGANNIANVMGVFVSSSPFTAFSVGGAFTVSSIQQLFLVGAAAIGVGVFTYSKRVMMTVGEGIVLLSPGGAWVVVVSQSIVLFLFSSVTLEHFLASYGFPTIPLIPVSSSQAVVGSVIGIGLLKGGKGIRWRALGNIASGWATTPIIALIVCFVSLFFLQNVFNQTVFHRVDYVLSTPVLSHLERAGVPVAALRPLQDKFLSGGMHFRDTLRAHVRMSAAMEEKVMDAAELYPLSISPTGLAKLDRDYLDPPQITALEALSGRSFDHRWQFHEALAEGDPSWRLRENNKVNKPFNKHLTERLGYVDGLFHVTGDRPDEEAEISGR